METNTTLGGLAPLIGIEDLAEYLDLPVKTLYKWRQEASAPPRCESGATSGTSSATSRTGLLDQRTSTQSEAR
jgi:hypothetical protein